VTHYVGVFSYDKPTTLDYLMYAQLLNSTASFRGGACNATSDCTTAYPSVSGVLCAGGTCLAGTTRFHYAYGTGLQYSNAAGAWQVVNASKGTWTESVWRATDVSIALASSTNFQIMELVVGLVVLGLSIGAVYGLGRYIQKRKKE